MYLNFDGLYFIFLFQEFSYFRKSRYNWSNFCHYTL